MRLLPFLLIISLISLTTTSTTPPTKTPTTPNKQQTTNQVTPQPKNNQNKRIPFPDFNSPYALRHFIYDILRTVANGLVDGYNGRVTYFRDYDCFSQAFQLAVQGQFNNFFYSLITFEWLFHPINSYNSIKGYSKLWRKELYVCGKELTQDSYRFFFQNNLVLSLATVSARFNLLFPLIMYNLAKASLNGILFNVYGLYKPIGIIIKYLIGARPVSLW